jgi:ribonuclease P protein component
VRRSATQSRGSRLRRFGIRASAGPWSIYADRIRAQQGGLIVALGRTAGSAVTRSRIRRIARDIFRRFETEQAVLLDVLLLARSDVSSRPRRQVRADLSGLAARAFGALVRRETKSVTNA